MNPAIVYVKFPKRKFGVELELNEKIHLKALADVVAKADPKRSVTQSEIYAASNNNDFWHVKFDRSCSDVKNKGGWEIASYVCRGFKDVKNIGKVVKAVKEAGAAINENCAFHVHGEASDFTNEQMAVLVANWMKAEWVLVEALPKHRRNNKYSRLMTKRFELDTAKTYTPGVFYNAIRPRHFGPADRRVALNLCNYASGVRPTIELRLPEASLEAIDAKNWVRLFVQFINVSRKAAFPGNIEPVTLTEALKIFGLHSENPFYLLSRGLREAKMWLLRRIMKFSGRKRIREEAEDILYSLQVPEPIMVKQPEIGPPNILDLAQDAVCWWKMPGAFKE